MLIQTELDFMRVTLCAVGVEGLMDCLELPRVSTEIVGVLRVIHLADLILSQLHVVQLVIVEVEVALTRDLLLIFFI
jgi:hypothetical protein